MVAFGIYSKRVCGPRFGQPKIRDRIRIADMSSPIGDCGFDVGKLLVESIDRAIKCSPV